MRPSDRVILIDLENVVGFRPKRQTLRSRITALLDAAGPYHHAVAAYAVDDSDDDPTASVLAALGVAPLRVPPGADAAELALLAHARRMQADGCMVFTVCSSDHAFTALAESDATRVEVLVWQGQPVSTKLTAAVDQVRRLSRPGDDATNVDDRANRAETAPNLRSQQQRHKPSPLLNRVLTGILTGLGIALGQRFGELILPHRRSDGAGQDGRS